MDASQRLNRQSLGANENVLCNGPSLIKTGLIITATTIICTIAIAILSSPLAIGSFLILKPLNIILITCLATGPIFTLTGLFLNCYMGNNDSNAATSSNVFGEVELRSQNELRRQEISQENEPQIQEQEELQQTSSDLAQHSQIVHEGIPVGNDSTQTKTLSQNQPPVEVNSLNPLTVEPSEDLHEHPSLDRAMKSMDKLINTFNVLGDIFKNLNSSLDATLEEFYEDELRRREEIRDRILDEAINGSVEEASSAGSN